MCKCVTPINIERCFCTHTHRVHNAVGRILLFLIFYIFHFFVGCCAFLDLFPTSSCAIIAMHSHRARALLANATLIDLQLCVRMRGFAHFHNKT